MDNSWIELEHHQCCGQGRKSESGIKQVTLTSYTVFPWYAMLPTVIAVLNCEVLFTAVKVLKVSSR